MKNTSGLSLVEVLVAFAILNVAILPLISMYPAIFKLNQRTIGLDETTRVAQQVVEYIKGKGYRGINNAGILPLNEDYPLTPIATQSFTNTNFASTFGYIDGGNNFFVLNGKKGFNLGEVTIHIELINTNVDLLKTTGTAVEKSNFYTNFIAGVVIVGRGNTDPSKPSKKQYETRLQFVITPIE